MDAPANLPPLPPTAEPPVPAPESVMPTFAKAKFPALMARAWQLMKAIFWRFFGLVAIGLIATSVITGAIYFGLTLVAGPIVGGVASGIVGLVLQGWLGAALYGLVTKAEEGVGIGGAMKMGVRSFVPFVWASVLATTVRYGGVLMLFVPAIIWSVTFWMLPFVLMTEDRRGMSALVRARQLVKGDGWWLFGMQLSLSIRLIGILLIPLVLYAVNAAMIRSQVLSVILGLVGLLAVLGVIIVGLPLTLALMRACFEDLRARKDQAPVAKNQKTIFVVAAILGVVPMLLSVGSGFTAKSKPAPLPSLNTLGITSFGNKSASALGTESDYKDFLRTLKAYHDVNGKYPGTDTKPPNGITYKPDATGSSFQISGSYTKSDGSIQTFYSSSASVFAALEPDASAKPAPAAEATSTPVAPQADVNIDTDNDGLVDADETNVFGTDPMKSDTDGDGYGDGAELKSGYDPLTPKSALTPDEIAKMKEAMKQFPLHAITRETLKDAAWLQ